MKDLTELQDCLRERRPVPWEQLPDFALYMDQVLSYMERQVLQIGRAPSELQSQSSPL